VRRRTPATPLRSSKAPRYLAVAPVAIMSASQVYWVESPCSRIAARSGALVDMVIDDLGGKALGMAAHALHQADPAGLDIPWPVVHSVVVISCRPVRLRDQQGRPIARAA